MGRLLTSILVVPLAFFVSHCGWYALPKWLKGTEWGEAHMPLGFSFYDRTNFGISIAVSSGVAVVAVALVWRLPALVRDRRSRGGGFPVVTKPPG
ncbi:MAG TPA: hypothetical protein VF796_14120 [Humisphaera sp.]